MPSMRFLFLSALSTALIDRKETCDVVVTESSVGGVMAALQSAAQGAKTCLVSSTDWLGGQMSTRGICAIDAPHQLGALNRYFLANFVESKRGGPKAGDLIVDVQENGLIPAGTRTITRRGIFNDETMKCLDPWMDRIRHRASCWVSFDCCRPSDADLAARELLEPYVKSGRLKIFYETVPKHVHMDGARIGAVEFISRRYRGEGPKPYAVPLSKEIGDWYAHKNSVRYEKSTLLLKGKIFVDPSETGELLALSGAEYALGAQDDDCVVRNPEQVMGYVNVLNLAMDKIPSEEWERRKLALDRQIADACPEIAAPEAFAKYAESRFYLNWKSYAFWASPKDPFGSRSSDNRYSLASYRRISNSPDVTMMNFGQSQPDRWRNDDVRGGNDYSFGNVLATPAELPAERKDWRGGLRVEELRRAECHSLAFAKWLAEQPDVRGSPDAAGRSVWPILDLQDPANFFGTGTGLAKLPYIRDTRHVRGLDGYCMKVSEFGTDFRRFERDPDKRAVFAKFRRGPYYAASPHSIGIASYAFDSRLYPDGHPLQIKGAQDMRMSEIPLEALVSGSVPNLLAGGMNIALHQAVGTAARTQPFECNVGRGAGAAAAVAAAKQLDLHQLARRDELVREVQDAIIGQGGTTGWFVNRRAGVEESEREPATQRVAPKPRRARKN